MADIILTDEDIKRFWLKTRWNPWNGCLEWTGGKISTGYGCIRLNGHSALAHRVAWVLANGQIPPGLFVCHHCDNPPCINVEHLFVGTNADNIADMVQKCRSKSYTITHCPKGHPYSDENTKGKRPKRGCRTCHREGGILYRTQHRDEICAKKRAAYAARVARAKDHLGIGG